jgi:hypothetical protein
MYGCKFDANDNATACGLATVGEKNDEVMIVEATKEKLIVRQFAFA